MASPSPTIGRQVASGAIWILSARVFQVGTSLLSTAVLARLLAPADFGLVAMVTVVTGFITIFRTLGTTSAIIQRKDITPGFIASVFWANVALGALAAIAGVSLAPVMAWFYRQQAVAPLMSWLSISLFIEGLSSTNEAMLTRTMAFHRLALVEVIAAICYAVTAIGMAATGYNAWSLVVATLVTNACSAVMLMSITRLFPRPQIRWSDLKGIVSFSLNLSGFNVLNYFARNADNFLIGRYLGAASLGYYQFAYTLMLFPIQNISHQFGRVLLPAFAHLQDDNEAFRRAYLRSCAAIAAVAFPMMMGLMVVAGPLVLTFLGPKWAPVVPIITVLALVGMAQSVVVTVGNIYTAKGRTDLLLRTAIAANLFILPAFVIGLRWDALGVAVAYAISYLALSYFLLAYAFRLIDLTMREFAASVSWCLLYSTIMGAFVWTVKLALVAAGVTNPAILLTSCVSIGILTYILLLIVTKPAVLVEMATSESIASIPGGRFITRMFAVKHSITTRD